MDDVPQRDLTELRDHAPQIGMVRQIPDALDDIANEPCAYSRHTLLGIPGLVAFKINQRRLGESNLCGRALFEAKPDLGFTQRYFPPHLQVGQTFNYGTHERAFLLGRLVLGHRLHDRNAPPSAGQKHGTARFRGMPHHTSGIRLQIGQWNDIRGEPDCHDPRA